MKFIDGGRRRSRRAARQSGGRTRRRKPFHADAEGVAERKKIVHRTPVAAADNPDELRCRGVRAAGCNNRIRADATSKRESRSADEGLQRVSGDAVQEYGHAEYEFDRAGGCPRCRSWTGTGVQAMAGQRGRGLHQGDQRRSGAVSWISEGPTPRGCPGRLEKASVPWRR